MLSFDWLAGLPFLAMCLIDPWVIFVSVQEPSGIRSPSVHGVARTRKFVYFRLKFDRLPLGLNLRPDKGAAVVEAVGRACAGVGILVKGDRMTHVENLDIGHATRGMLVNMLERVSNCPLGQV